MNDKEKPYFYYLSYCFIVQSFRCIKPHVLSIKILIHERYIPFMIHLNRLQLSNSANKASSANLRMQAPVEQVRKIGHLRLKVSP